MRTRRGFLRGAALAGTALWLRPGALRAAAQPVVRPLAGLAEAFARIEAGSGGRLGVALHDGQGHRLAGQRDDERFPMCSTFKFLLAATVLQAVDQGRLRLDQRVPVAASDLLPHSPETALHVGTRGMSVAELCRATLIWSDNAAANLLLPWVGGPAGVTGFVRAGGDALTRHDRLEPEVNLFVPGDDRDTTTPAAMAGNLRRYLVGDVLSPASRAQLAAWLRDNRTGDDRLRAGLPAGWTVGDKTGSNGRDITNDIAIPWPPGGREPVFLAAYLQGATGPDEARDAALAAVARAVAAAL